MYNAAAFGVTSERGVSAMHFHGRFDEGALRPHPVFAAHATGYTQADLVSRATASVHTGLSIAQLAARLTKPQARPKPVDRKGARH